MLRHHNTSITPTLRVFISKVITPAVLVAGLLLLILFNFRAVLKTTVSASDRFHGQVTFSQGAFSYRFKETAGIDRPLVRYTNEDLLTYAEWSSTLAVDGNVQQLWDNDHGYSYDETRYQAFSTITGNDWQLIEVVTLVNDHMMTVTYNLVPQPVDTAPAQYVLDIVHIHNSWYGYQATENTFKALVTNDGPIANNVTPPTIGAISFKVEGNAVPHPLLKVNNARSTIGEKSAINQANAFTTEYVVDNPVPHRMIILGTEIITFQPGASNTGAPLPGSVPLPGLP